MTIPQKANILTDSAIQASWHSMSTDDVLQKLETHHQEGLTTQEASRRLQQHGRNELKEKPRPTFL